LDPEQLKKSAGCLVAHTHARLLHRMQKMGNFAFLCAKIGKKDNANKTAMIHEVFVIICNLKLIFLHFQCVS